MVGSKVDLLFAHTLPKIEIEIDLDNLIPRYYSPSASQTQSSTISSISPPSIPVSAATPTPTSTSSAPLLFLPPFALPTFPFARSAASVFFSLLLILLPRCTGSGGSLARSPTYRDGFLNTTFSFVAADRRDGVQCSSSDEGVIDIIVVVGGGAGGW